MFLRRLLMVAVLALACGQAVSVARPVPPGHFSLVYVYEANTHMCDDNSLDPPRALLKPGTYVENGHLYAGDEKPPARLTCLCAITEVSEAGESRGTTLAKSMLPLMLIAIGDSGSPHRLMNGRVLVRVVDDAGTIQVRFRGLTRTIPAGASWSVATSDREGLRGIYEDSSAEYQQVMDASSDGARASRLMVYNHGSWDLARVKVAGS